MSPLSPNFDARLYILLLALAFILDITSWMVGKKSNLKDKERLNTPFKCIGKTPIYGRFEYYPAMIISLAVTTAFVSFFAYRFHVSGNEVLAFALFFTILVLQVSIRRILCINMSWICYDGNNVYWRKWNSTEVRSCKLMDVIDYRIKPGAGGQIFYLYNGEKIHLFDLCKNLEDMCNRSGITEWRKKTGFDPFR